MIKQSLLNRFTAKYVKAGIGDETELYDIPSNDGQRLDESQSELERMKDSASKHKLSPEEQIFDNLNKIFVSYLNNDVPGMKYGALRVLAKPPISWAPMIDLIQTKEEAQKEFLAGNTDMAPYFLEMQRIFKEDMRIGSVSGRDEFTKFIIEVAKANNAFDFAHKSSAQILWNKLGNFYKEYVNNILKKLGVDIDVDVDVDVESMEKSFTPGTQSGEVGELFKDLSKFDPIFNEYKGAFGISYALGLFDDSGMEDVVPKLARKYSRVGKISRDTTHTTEYRHLKDEAIQKIVNHQMFPKIVEILTDSLAAYETEVAGRELDASEKRPERAKQRREEEKLNGYNGLATDGTGTQFPDFLKFDTDLYTDPRFGIFHAPKAKAMMFLKTLKKADLELFNEFSRGVRSSLLVSQRDSISDLTDEEKKKIRDKQVNEFKATDVYKKALQVVNGVYTGATNRTPTITDKTSLQSKDSEVAALKEKIQEYRLKRTKYMNMKSKAKAEGNKEKEDKIREAQRSLENSISILLEQAKKLGVTI